MRRGGGSSQRAPRITAALVVLAAGAGARGGDEGSKVPFQELAKAFREERGLSEPAADCDAMLESGAYVSLDLGTFQLWYPIEFLHEKDRCEDLEQVLEAAVGVHERWLDYAYFGVDGYDAAVADLDVLRDWVESLSFSDLKRIEPGHPSSLLARTEADPEVVEAADRLRAFVRTGVKSRAWQGGWDNEGIHLTRVLFTPTRRSFLEHTAFAGEVDEAMRPVNWDDDMVRRTSSWCGRMQIVAMENAAWPPNEEKPFAGASMNSYVKDGLVQHVVDRLAMSLLRDVYFYYGVHFFEEAVATNLVIAVTGRNSIGFTWSYEWKRQGAQTQAYSRFVPGGNPSGGVLPQRKAQPGPIQAQVSYISEWNRSMGEDYFLEPLKKSQKKGAKEAGRDRDNPLRQDKTAHFELRNEEGGTAVVSAPFFGPAAEGKDLPPFEFLDDYEEFFRAYRSCFFEWIRTHAGGDEEASRAKFRELIEAQATRDVSTSLEEVVQKVYGVPLSAADGEVDSLEWRFLAWLPKGR